MAQTDSFALGNVPGATFRGSLNEILAALQSTNAGATAPTATAPGMLWLDTSVSPGVLKQRNNANDAWVAIAAADGSVTNAKLADVATATLKGRVTAGTGAPEDLTVGQVQTMLGIAALTQAQAENRASTVLGTVSGQLLGQAAANWGYESSQTAIPTASSATFTHGLGVRPRRYQIVVQCITAQLGYAVDDEFQIGGGGESSVSDDYGGNVTVNATSIIYSDAGRGQFLVPIRGGATNLSITSNANWRLVARASL